MIELSKDLILPDEAVTETFAILAKRGGGKTYTALKMAEQMSRAGHQIIYTDPIGVCWGLRTSADGKHPGIPIVIFGGDHADVPLNKTAGVVVAEVAVKEKLSMVLDLSHLRKGEQRSFMVDFAETLYQINRSPLHVFLDEADLYAPQRPRDGDQRMLGAIEDLVRRGRAKGIGITMITQRAAVLNKNVLTQIEALIILRTTSPQDKAALDAWVQEKNVEEEADQMKASLSSLPIGTAWFWSPGWLEKFIKVKIGRRETFDSSVTPKAGAASHTPQVRAEVDLAALEKKIAGTIEKIKADDPAELKRQIYDLRRQAAQQGKTIGDLLTAQKPACNHGPEMENLKAVISSLKSNIVNSNENLFNDLGNIYDKQKIFKESCLEIISGAELPAKEAAQNNAKPDPKRAVIIPLYPQLDPPKQTQNADRAASVGALGCGHPTSEVSGEELVKHFDVNSGITKSQQKIIDALAAFEARGLQSIAKQTLAAFCRVSSRSSGYTNNLGSLRTRGYIKYPDPNYVCLIDAGRAMAQCTESIDCLADLHRGWMSVVSAPQGRILTILIDLYPRDIGRNELAERVHVSAKSSGYTNNLGRLRTVCAVEYPKPGRVKASGLLFIEGLI